MARFVHISGDFGIVLFMEEKKIDGNKQNYENSHHGIPLFSTSPVLSWHEMFTELSPPISGIFRHAMVLKFGL